MSDQASLKVKTTKGLFWSALERFSVQGLQFVLGLVLARLLLPSDYGLIGMLAIFLAVAQTFVDSGFSWALVQKKDRTEDDYSTTFYTNIVLGVFFYLLLFFAAPYIAAFYKTPELVLLTRVFSLNVLIVSFGVVQRSKLTIELDFKTQAKASLISVVLGGVVGITMALKGYGVWSLAFQYLIQNTVSTFLFWVFSKWRPKLHFSLASFKSLFRFGSKVLGAGLLETIYDNIYLIVIGRLFNATALGFYTRAQQLQRMPSHHLTHIIQRVSFPVLSELQDDDERLLHAFKKVIRLSAFVVFPLMIGLAMLAEPFIELVLTAKWLPAAPFLQWMCIAGMLIPVHAINLSVLNVKGRSDLYLRLEIIQKVLITIAILITFSFGIKVMIIGQVITSLLSFFINTHYTGRLINYGRAKQVSDLFPVIVISASMALVMWPLIAFVDHVVLKLFIGSIAGILVYFIAARIGQFKELNDLREMVGVMMKKTKE